jgi:hypothetical protein
MLETLIWPLVVVVCALGALLIFRSPIAALIGRIRLIKLGNKRIDVGGELPKPAIEQRKELPSPELPSAAAAGMPPASDVYQSLEQEIMKGAASIKGPPEVQQAWLVRAVAVLRVAYSHEVTYRLIVGSQLDLLLLANSLTPPDTAKAQELYEVAKANFPEVYANWAFETWLGWPQNAGLIRLEQAGVGLPIVKITPAGRDLWSVRIASAR